MKNLCGNAASALTLALAVVAAHAQQDRTGGRQQAQPQEQQQQAQRQGRQAPASNAGDGPAVLVLMPVPVVTSSNFANGCWVRFYDNDDYRGDSVTLSGPVDVPDADRLQGVWRDWDSAVVGPKARVTVYDNDNYRERTAVLNSGQHTPDLGARELGMFQEINSLRVQCLN